jgi:hypothetical protein
MEAGWRSHQHDDLCLALAIAAWLGEAATRQFWLRQGGETFTYGSDPPPPGPRRTVLADGTIIEETPAGRQVTYPGTPARRGTDAWSRGPEWAPYRGRPWG